MKPWTIPKTLLRLALGPHAFHTKCINHYIGHVGIAQCRLAFGSLVLPIHRIPLRKMQCRQVLPEMMLPKGKGFGDPVCSNFDGARIYCSSKFFMLHSFWPLSLPALVHPRPPQLGAAVHGCPKKCSGFLRTSVGSQWVMMVVLSFQPQEVNNKLDGDCQPQLDQAETVLICSYIANWVLFLVASSRL